VREWHPTVTYLPTHPVSPGADVLDGPTIARITGGTLLARSDRPVVGGTVDSRHVAPANLFVALTGERTDGHRFLRDAVGRGAAALLVSELPSADDLGDLAALAPGGVSVVRVPDTLTALHAVAGAWRARFSPLVVGITGSVAKTSTKEATAAVLSTRRRVLRSEGNENNEIGLPLTLLRLDRTHEVAVVEMGMYVAGEIAQLAAIARPAIGVVTAVRGIHVERAGSLDEIERGKAQLVEALPGDGIAVLNGDDPRVRGMAARTSARPVFYGLGPGNDVTGMGLESLGGHGMRFQLCAPGGVRLEVRTPVLGRHGVQNGLAAAAVGLAAGLAPEDVVRGLAAGWSAPHRDALLVVGDWRVLDDTYNAGPDSMVAALDLLATLPGRRVAVLGEMLELGPETGTFHRGVGSHAATQADLLIVVGEGARPIAEGARAAGMPANQIVETADRDGALRILLDGLRAGDTVLFKASRGVALDLLVEALADAATMPTGRTTA
jgi:UDP-N-acetylmuramoyl-tripeptide--D-alanyl-D-alanine ligase